MTADHLVTLDGITNPISEWALDYGIPASLILERLERGWPEAKAITKPMFALRGQRLPKTRRPRPVGQPMRGRLVACAGRSLTIRQWSECTGIHVATINMRLRTGWPVDKTLGMAGVGLDLPENSGTGGGSTAQHFPQLEISE